MNQKRGHHYYVEKLGIVGVYLFFLIFAPKHRLWVLVRTASARKKKYVHYMVKYL